MLCLRVKHRAIRTSRSATEAAFYSPSARASAGHRWIREAGAVEDQATDRAHRIGQTRPVTVVRLVSRGTIEEAVVALHEEKRELAEAILGGAGASGKLSVAELGALLRAGVEGAA